MQKRLFLLSVATIILFVCVVLSYAQTNESITVTTYYPSPYGVYKNLRFFPNTDNTPGTACGNEGETYYDAIAHALYICSGSPAIWAPASVPQKAVMFFNDNSGPNSGCPSGWSPLIGAQGRYVVGLQPGGVIRGTQGSALFNQEDRPAGAHFHTYSTLNYGGGAAGLQVGAGNLNFHTFNTGVGTPLVPGTNAPYIQLLACEKN